jgi:hypothetical protein
MICESGGRTDAYERPGDPGGPQPHMGLFQFDYTTWQEVGGHGDPRDASAEEQWMRAVMLVRKTGGFSRWECARKLGYA